VRPFSTALYTKIKAVKEKMLLQNPKLLHRTMFYNSSNVEKLERTRRGDWLKGRALD
jgi:hypothetical protein